MIKRLLSITVVAITVQGCANLDNADKGAMIGGGLGAAVSYVGCPNAVCGVLGAGAGSLIGYQLGKQTDIADDKRKKAVQQRLPPSPFEAELMNRQAVRDKQIAQINKNGSCKEFSEEVVLSDGNKTTSKGVVCKNEAGDWIIQ